MTLAGNLVGVGLGLVGAFADSGPSADEIVIGQIAALREEVRELRREMHERFDRLHEHLDAVYEEMISGFAGLESRNIQRFQQTIDGLRDTKFRLSEVGEVQLDAMGILIGQAELLADLITNMELNPCLRSHGPPGSGDEMDLEKFRDCRAKLEAVGEALLARQFEGPVASAIVAELIENSPDRAMSLSLREFRRLLTSSGVAGEERAMRLPTAVVWPESWFWVAERYEVFHQEYRDQAAEDPVSRGESAFAQRMRKYRTDLLRYAEAIREELISFQSGARQSVFGTLLENVWDREGIETFLNERTEPLGTGEFEALARQMDIADAHLRSWVTLGLFGVLDKSDTVAAIADGRIGFPDVRQVFEGAGAVTGARTEARTGAWAWAVDEVSRRIRALSRVLQSIPLQDAVVYSGEYGHWILTQSRFETLGDLADGVR